MPVRRVILGDKLLEAVGCAMRHVRVCDVQLQCMQLVAAQGVAVLSRHPSKPVATGAAGCTGVVGQVCVRCSRVGQGAPAPPSAFTRGRFCGLWQSEGMAG